MKGYLKLIDGVPTLVNPNGNIKLKKNPPPKFLNHLVEYNEETEEITLIKRR